MDPFSLDHIFPRRFHRASLHASRVVAPAGTALRPASPRSLSRFVFPVPMDRLLRVFFFPSLELSKNLRHGLHGNPCNFP